MSSSRLIATYIVMVLLGSAILLPYSVYAQAMTSGNYKIQADSINFAGGKSTSGSYSIQDTAGEIASGKSEYGNSSINAGYQQSDGSTVANGVSSNIPGGTNSANTLQVNVLNFKAYPSILPTQNILLSWKYPVGGIITSVRIVRSDKFFPTTMDEGEVIFEGDAEQVFDTHVVPGVRYYYALFAKNIRGEYSSGVLAMARITPVGETYTPDSLDPFATVPQALDVDNAFAKLTLADFDFIQDGRLIAHADSSIAIDAMKELTIRLDYNKVPEILKTIAITLVDPNDVTKAFTFLLRVNKDKTAYEAVIGSLSQSGTYILNAIILDYKNQSIKRFSGDLRAFALASSADFVKGISKNPRLLSGMIGFLILAFILITLSTLVHFKKQRAIVEKTTLLGLILLIVFGSFSYPHSARAAFNPEINYQGKLANSQNQVLSGDYNVRFKLYTSATGGTALWTETTRLTIENGLFSFMLGSVTPLSGIDFNQTLYLGVEVGGTSVTPSWDGEMSPRKVIGAVPAAFVADTLDGLDSTKFYRVDAGSVSSGYFISTSTTASTLPYASTTALSATELFATNFHVSSLTVSGLSANSLLSTDASGVITATSTPTFGNFNATSTIATSTIATGGFVVGTSQFVVQSGSGNIGIGTTTPNDNVSIVRSGSAGTALTVYNGNTTGIQVIRYGSTAGAGFGTLKFGGTMSAQTAVGNNEAIGRFQSNGWDGTTSQVAGYLHFLTAPSTAGSISSTNLPGEAAIVLNGGGSNNNTIERVRITYLGNMGIGTTTPGQKLSVAGDILGNALISSYFTATSTTATSTIAGGFTVGSDYLNVLQNGNVGIGTSSPLYLLHLYNSNNASQMFFDTSVSASTTLKVQGTTDADVSVLGTRPGILLRRSATGQTGRFFKTLSNKTILSHNINGSTGASVYNLDSTGQDGWMLSMTDNVGGNSNFSIDYQAGGITTSFTPTNYFKLTSSGNIGIGSTTPGAKLSIHANDGSSAQALFTIASSTASATTTLFTVLNSGYVGVGTTSPTVNFQIEPTTGTGDVNVIAKNSIDSTARILISAKNDQNKNATLVAYGSAYVGNFAGINAANAIQISGGTSPSAMFIGESSLASPIYLGHQSANIPAITILQGSVSALGSIGIGTTTPGGTFSIAGNAGGTKPVFIVSTSTAGFATTTVAEIDGNGNALFGLGGGSVGIGTGAPGAKLHVSGGDILLDNAKNLSWKDNNTGAAQAILSLGIDNSTYLYSPVSGGNLIFSTSAGSIVERMRITSTGNVGIATSSPYAKLSVVGSSGTLIAADAISGFTGNLLDLKVASTTKVIVDSSGNVGVGTTSPTQVVANSAVNGLLFQVANTSGVARMAVSGTSQSDYLAIANSAASNFRVARFRNSNGVISIDRVDDGFTNVFSSPFTIDTTDFIGIGTTTPGAKLSVGGTILGNDIVGSYFTATTSTATSTFIGGATFATGGGNVGIGTLTPTATLTVANATGGGIIEATRPGITLKALLRLINLSDSSGWEVGMTAASDTTNNFYIRDKDLGRNIFRLEDGSRTGSLNIVNANNPSGMVGIGTTTPGATLAVTGLGGSGNGNIFLASDSSEIPRFVVHETGLVGVGTSSPGARFGITAAGATTGRVFAIADSNNKEKLTIFDNGTVGIATTTPGAKLSVGGTILGHDIVGSYFTATTTTASTFPYASTTAISSGNGWFTGNLGVGTTSSAWTALAVSGLDTTSNTVVQSWAYGNTSGNNQNYHLDLLQNIPASGVVNWSFSQTNNGTRYNNVLNLNQGNVGIGSTTPSESLAVNGNIIVPNNADYRTYTSTGVKVTALALNSSNIWSIASGNIGVDNSNGNVGIGSSTPYAKLSVKGAGSTTGVNFQTTNSSNSPLVTMLDSGNVGIGTTTPGTKLTVDLGNGSSGVVDALQLSNTNGANSDNGSAIYFSGYASRPQALISSYINPSQFVGGTLQLQTYQNTVTPTLNVGIVLDKAGNVGVGTTSPGSRLHVYTGASGLPISNAGINLENSTHQYLSFSSTANTQQGIVFNGGSSQAANDSTISWEDGTRGDMLDFKTNGTSRMSITLAGNIGIGTTTPSTLLQLANTGNAQLVLTDTDAASGLKHRYIQNSNGIMYFGKGTDAGLGINGLTDQVVIDNSGNLGIGTTTPAATLNTSLTNSAATQLLMTRLGSTLGATAFDFSSGDSRVGARSNYRFLTGINTMGDFTSATERFTILSSGEVGVGSSTPSGRLSISGSTSNSSAVNTIIADSGDRGRLRILDNGLMTFCSGTGGSSGACTGPSGAVYNFVASNTNGYTTGLATYGGTIKLHETGDGPEVTSGLEFQTSGSGNGYGYKMYTNNANDYFAIGTRYSSATWTNALTVKAQTGNVGIGTTSPASTLTVVGSACISGGAGSTAACSTTAGTISYRASNTANVDLAESYITSDLSVEPGDLVAVDPSTPLTIKKADSTSTLLGVVSTAPGVLLGGANSNLQGPYSRPVALSGRIPVKVNNEGGSIAIGDPITLSSTPGVGTKATVSTTVIGYALEAFTGTSGTIEVFVKLGYHSVPAEIARIIATSTPAVETTPVFDLASTTQAITTSVQANVETSLATSTTFIGKIADAVKNLIQTTGEWVLAKITAKVALFDSVEALSIKTQTLEAKTATISDGLQMTDSSTGQIYCVRITNGDFQKTFGACGSAPTTNISTIPIAPAMTSSPTPTPAPVIVAPESTPTQTVTSTTATTSTDTTATSTTATAATTESAPTPEVTPTPEATPTPVVEVTPSPAPEVSAPAEAPAN